jgi:hypothetical protein
MCSGNALLSYNSKVEPTQFCYNARFAHSPRATQRVTVDHKEVQIKK